MKLSAKKRILFRICEKREERRRRSKEKRILARINRFHPGAHTQRTAKRRRKRIRIPPLRVQAPEVFLLQPGQHREAVMALIAAMRQRVIVEDKPILIDFSRTKRMYPCGTLLLFAEIDRIQRTTGKSRAIRGSYPADMVVEQVLQHLGILRMLRLKERTDPRKFAENVRHWRHASGRVALGEVVEPIVDHYESAIAEPQRRDLYAGMTEAMINTLHHAYPDGHRCPKWWMFSQGKDGELTVALCDMGVGIPASIGDSNKWSQSIVDALRSLLPATQPQSELIKIATEINKTRTGEQHRGKGFSEILDVVRKSKSGYLQIMSHRGFYRFDGVTCEESTRDDDVSILGTVVQWTIPLQESPE